MHYMGNKNISFVLTRASFGNVTVTFLDDTPNRDNCYAQLCKRYINLAVSSSQNRDLSSLV